MTPSFLRRTPGSRNVLRFAPSSWALAASVVLLCSCANTVREADGTGGASAGGTGGTPGGSQNGTGGRGVPPSEWTQGIPPLHTEGNEFRDAEGNRVVLRGVAVADVSDLNLDRGDMNAVRLLDLLSDAAEGWYARVVRLTVYPERWLVDPEGYLEEHLKPAVEHASSRGLYVIIDWHEISHVELVAERTEAFWRLVAPHFANHTNVLFELFNEPIETDDPSWSRWKGYAQPWVDLIRESAPHNVILIGGPIWSQQIGGAATDPFEGENLAYVGHIYPIIDPFTWSASGPFAQVAQVRPLMITEWGFRNDGGEIWDATQTSFGEPVKSFIENQGASWTAWCADSVWSPLMFDENWQLLEGPGEMGGFVKDWLAERKDDDQPQR